MILLSIPLWCDWDDSTRTSIVRRARLSIPLWCDWDHGEAQFLHHTGLAFNPTVVRLGLGLLCAVSTSLVPSFNPTVVRLGLCRSYSPPI